MKLYYHKTDGGAEYLYDTFIKWEHNGKSGKEGVINDKTKYIVRIDGDIEKDAEINIRDTLITDKEFLQEQNEDEIFSVIESFLNRLKRKDWGIIDETTGREILTKEAEKGKIVILDNAKFQIIKQMIKNFKRYKN